MIKDEEEEFKLSGGSYKRCKYPINLQKSSTSIVDMPKRNWAGDDKKDA